MPAAKPTNNVIKIIAGKLGEFPLKLGIIPNRLAVTVYQHTLINAGIEIPCWSLITEGMVALQQKEFIFTLRILQGEDARKFPNTLVQLFIVFYKQATQKKTVNIGDVLPLGANGLFGFSGMGFSHPLLNHPGIKINPNSLTCLLLSKEELIVAQKFGLMRVMNRLGYEKNSYPCLAWNDRERKGLMLKTVFTQSQLNQTYSVKLPTASACLLDGERVVLNISAKAQPILIKLLQNYTPSQPLCLLLNYADYQDGSLVWLADRDHVEIHSPADSAGRFIAGSFIMFTPGAEHDGAAMLEDGFNVRLTKDGWQKFKAALAATRNLELDGAGGDMHFSLSWNNAFLNQVSAVPNDTQDDEDEGILRKLMNKLFRRN